MDNVIATGNIPDGEYFRCEVCDVKYDHTPDFVKGLRASMQGWCPVGTCLICSGDLKVDNLLEDLDWIVSGAAGDEIGEGIDEDVDIKGLSKTISRHTIALLHKRGILK